MAFQAMNHGLEARATSSRDTCPNRRIRRCAGRLHPPALRATPFKGGIDPFTCWVNGGLPGVAALDWGIPPLRIKGDVIPRNSRLPGYWGLGFGWNSHGTQQPCLHSWANI